MISFETKNQTCLMSSSVHVEKQQHPPISCPENTSQGSNYTGFNKLSKVARSRRRLFSPDGALPTLITPPSTFSLSISSTMSSTPPAPPPPSSPERVLGVGSAEFVFRCSPKPEPNTTQQIRFTAEDFKRIGAMLEKAGDEELSVLLRRKLSLAPGADARASEVGADTNPGERMGEAEMKKKAETIWRQFEEISREPCLTLDEWAKW